MADELPLRDEKLVAVDCNLINSFFSFFFCVFLYSRVQVNVYSPRLPQVPTLLGLALQLVLLCREVPLLSPAWHHSKLAFLLKAHLPAWQRTLTAQLQTASPPTSVRRCILLSVVRQVLQFAPSLLQAGSGMSMLPRTSVHQLPWQRRPFGIFCAAVALGTCVPSAFSLPPVVPHPL